MLNNGHGGPGQLARVTQDDYKPVACACGSLTFKAVEFYSLVRFRFGVPPAGVPEVVRLKATEMVCEKCDEKMPPPFSDPRPA